MPKPLRLNFTSRAILDVQRALEELHQISPQASIVLENRLYKTCQNLALFPRMGVQLPLESTPEEIRFFPLTHTKYSIVFSISDQEVLVLRFLHDTLDWKTQEDWT